MTALRSTTRCLSFPALALALLASPASAQIGPFPESPRATNLYCSVYPSSCPTPTRVLAGARATLDTLCADDPDDCLERTPPPSEQEIIALWSELERLIHRLEGYESLDAGVRLGLDLSEACDADPARCATLVSEQMRWGALDGDRDGVIDLGDRCPGTPSPLARAQAILASQESALREIRNVLGHAMRLASISHNGTVGEPQQEVLAEQIADLWLDLLAVANASSDGRHLFGGLRDDAPPFRVRGSFGPDSTPVVTYEGDDGRLSLPVDRAGGDVPITIPGAYLFLGDLDGDGVHPDPGRTDVFAFLAEGYTALRSSESAADWIVELDSFVDELFVIGRENSELYARTKRVVASPAIAGVDAAGCSQEQFCESIELASRRDWRICERSDFQNDEPLRRRPRDCRVRWDRKDGARCVSAASSARRHRSGVRR